MVQVGETGNPLSIMFAPLHQVCTGISGKVQTKMPARAMTILLSEVHIERYVQIRRVVCTVCTRNGEPPRGGNPGPGACEIRTGANIPAIPEDRRRIRKMGAIQGYSWCKSGCKRGANGCKGATRPAPGGRDRPGTFPRGWARPRLVRPLRIG